LSRVDEFLSSSEFVKPFFERFHTRIGGPSTPIDTFIRLMYLKHRYGLGYEMLGEQVNDSVMWRRFCRIPLHEQVPDSHYANQASQALRVDTTVVEANIHYPTDASPIHDAVRVVSQ